jgi:hypothetical protein
METNGRLGGARTPHSPCESPLRLLKRVKNRTRNVGNVLGQGVSRSTESGVNQKS